MQYELFFSLFDTFSFLPRDRGNYKESAACPITKASNSSHFHIPLMFLFSTFPAMQYLRFVSLFDTFSHLSAWGYYTTRTGTCLVHLTKLSPVVRGYYLAGWPNTNTPCCDNFFFLFWVPFLFQGDLLGTAELPSLCNVVSSIYQLFVPHFAMAVCMFIYLHYRIIKQRYTSFEFSSILSTVELSNI